MPEFSVLEIVILAIVQGIAEFLPISSSGHLVILGAFLGLKDENPTLEIILHAGTLGSIFVIYWKRIRDLLMHHQRVIPLLAVGTIPAGILGVAIKTQAQWLLGSPALAGAMLIVTGGLLLLLKWLPEGDTEYAKMSYAGALAIGCFQAFALLPGLSRSGATIVGGRIAGLTREDAVTFSFLLAIPAILGASVLSAKDLLSGGTSGEQFGLLALGAALAFGVGIFALRWLIRWTQQGRLYLFAAWCIPAGIAVLAMYGSGFFAL